MQATYKNEDVMEIVFKYDYRYLLHKMREYDHWHLRDKMGDDRKAYCKEGVHVKSTYKCLLNNLRVYSRRGLQKYVKGFDDNVKEP